MKEILKLKKLKHLANLNIKGNPIDIAKKRLCLLECMILGEYREKIDEKKVVSYLTANYTHVPRPGSQRP